MSVFISYSRHDSEFVDLLHRLLTSKGYDAWLDRRDINAGSRWDAEIEAAIQQCSHMVVVLSPESAQSQNVADEWSYAFDEGKTIVPLLYRTASIPMRLRRVQFIDFVNQPFADAFRLLCDDLGKPDRRPSDPLALARREGFVLVDLGALTSSAPIRIAFVYSDYPQIGSLLKTIWFALLWRVFPRFEADHYGKDWALKDKVTGQICQLPQIPHPLDGLLNEMGIEPGSQLEIVLLKSGIKDE